MKMPDMDQTAVTEHLEPYLKEAFNQSIFTAEGVTEGFNKFLKQFADLVLDCPNLINFCSSVFYFLIID